MKAICIKKLGQLNYNSIVKIESTPIFKKDVIYNIKYITRDTIIVYGEGTYSHTFAAHRIHEQLVCFYFYDYFELLRNINLKTLIENI